MVVGRGTSDPDANSNITKVARMLWEGIGFGWCEVCYSGVTFPLVAPGLEHAVKLGYRRIIVFPYFLFTGVLVKRIYSIADEMAARHPEIEFLKAPYLNDHPLVLDAFAERVRGDPRRLAQHELPALQVPRAGASASRPRSACPQAGHHHHVQGIGTNADHAHDGHHHHHDHDHHGMTTTMAMITATTTIMATTIIRRIRTRNTATVPAAATRSGWSRVACRSASLTRSG